MTRSPDTDHGDIASIRQTVIAVKHTPMLGTPKTASGRRTVKPTAALLLRSANTANSRPRSGC
jgi:hypothetical protein